MRKFFNIISMLIRWGVKFMAGGHSSFFGLLNTFVHIIMYTYYMLAAMGPEMQKYLWWKKYLTQVKKAFWLMSDNVVKFLIFVHRSKWFNSLEFSHIASNSSFTIPATTRWSLSIGSEAMACCSISCSATFISKLTTVRKVTNHHQCQKVKSS